jgi:DNA-binding CsgD family transcriptional regulator
MANRDGVMRRVSVVDARPNVMAESMPNSTMGIAAPNDMDQDEDTNRLMTIVDGVADAIRIGACHANELDGVLLDVTVGNVRCLIVELEPTRLISLSPREQQIAGMVANGRTNQAIATSLEISVWTVSTHLRRIFAKLAVSSRAEMVAHLLANPDVARVIERG